MLVALLKNVWLFCHSLSSCQYSRRSSQARKNMLAKRYSPLKGYTYLSSQSLADCHDMEQIDINHPPSLHAPYNGVDKRRFAHSPFTVHNDILPGAYEAGKLLFKHRSRTVEVIFDHAPIPKWVSTRCFFS